MMLMLFLRAIQVSIFCLALFGAGVVSVHAISPDIMEDSSFTSNLGTGFNNTALGIISSSDSDIFAVGLFTEFNGATRNYIVRLNSDGTEDTDFYADLGTGFNNYIFSLYSYPDSGDLLIGGFFTQFNGNTRRGLVRLNSDGTEDTDFYTNLGTGFAGGIIPGVSVIRIQEDGDILAGGSFTTFNGNTRRGLVRLNSDGTEDTDFATNIGTGFNGFINNISLQPDGDILVVGGFNTFNGNTRRGLVRLNSDGTEDTDFYTNLGTGFENAGGLANISGMVVLSDGDILVGGAYTTLNGSTRNGLVRLNSDGTEDVDFYTNLGTGFAGAAVNDGVSAIVVQSGGDILVSGSFISLNDSPRNYIVRLNSDGTEDVDFYTDLGTAFNDPVAVALTTTGDIVAGGSFTEFNGNTRNKFILLVYEEISEESSDGASGGSRRVSGCGDPTALNYKKGRYVHHKASLCRYEKEVTTVSSASARDTILLQNRLVSLGEKGAHVQQLQTLLNTTGSVPALTPDGVFGLKTFTAVKNFQQRYNLKVDGIVGPMTVEMLRKI